MTFLWPVPYPSSTSPRLSETVAREVAPRGQGGGCCVLTHPFSARIARVLFQFVVAMMLRKAAKIWMGADGLCPGRRVST
jgi:hypothetical protein